MHKPGEPGRDRQAEGHGGAFLIPFFGTLLLMPPILNLFVGGRSVGGVPLEGLYLLTVWILVIAGAVVLSRHPAFRHSGDGAGDSEPRGDP